MRLLVSQQEISSTFNRLLKECKTVSFAVAWASCGFGSCDLLLSSQRKIRKSVVGTHFYQTDPRFIESLVGNKYVKFVTNPSGTFHPKAYLFEGAIGGWSCLIGSANFTNGGFGDNSELVVHISKSDDTSKAMVSKLQEQIDGYWNLKTAKYASQVDLEKYRFWKNHFKKSLDHLQGKFGVKKARKNNEEIEILNLDWIEFLSRIRRKGIHDLKDRVKVLSAAKQLFEGYGSLRKIPKKYRQGIAGFAEPDGVPWGWFGSMWGAGTFKRIVNENSKKLSDALDQIPLAGRVSKADYEAFVVRFIAAFPKKNGRRSRHGLGTATRLLAMRRPDYFVCLDKANKKGLATAFGISISHRDYDAYWDSIVDRICESKWWNSRRPTSMVDQEVWDGRTALLDAIYYVPIARNS